MSCLGPSYNPNPPRTWARFENDLNNIVSTSEGPIAMIIKANVLQYKKNSSRITKKQKYAQIAKGVWNRKKSYASQSDTHTYFNIRSLQHNNYEFIISNNVSKSNHITCSNIPIHYNNFPPTNNGDSTPINTPLIPPPSPFPKPSTQPLLPPSQDIPEQPPTIIPNGGTLTCSIIENFCSGNIIHSTSNNNCYPTTDSDVPGLGELCYDPKIPTYFPKKVYNPSSGSRLIQSV